jgi:hypothetical protein
MDDVKAGTRSKKRQARQPVALDNRKTRSPSEESEAESVARFTAAAKEAGCEDSESEFVGKLKAIAALPPETQAEVKEAARKTKAAKKRTP